MFQLFFFFFLTHCFNQDLVKSQLIMFYDVNIPYPNISDAKELERIEKILDRIYSSKKKKERL